jgi:hypothetical protein
MSDVFRAVERPTPFDLERLSDGFRRGKTDWTIPQAFLAVLLSAAVADGSLGQEDAAELQLLARRSRALRELSPEQLGEAEVIATERLQGRPDGLKEACETLPEEMCLSAFAYCVDIVLSDGELLAFEAEFLDSLVMMMRLDPSQARRILEVLMLKNSY